MSYRYQHLGNANGDGSVAFEVVVGDERATFPTMAAALDAASMSARRSSSGATIVSPPGSGNVMVRIGSDGRSQMIFAERRDEYDQVVEQLDQTAQVIGREAERAAQEISAGAKQTPMPILGVGIGALAGALLTRGSLLGAAGGAIAGYFVSKGITE